MAMDVNGARDELKTRIREANSIVDVIGAVVRLKKAGKSYKGLCPFHDEKTPSFNVNPDRQTFKCFGCGEAGDVFTFIEKTERVEFREALELLAERAGITIEESPKAAAAAARSRDQRVHLYRAQDLAARFFVAQLGMPSGERARAYLAGRGLTELAGRFGLGYAPAAWDTFSARYGTSATKQRWLVASGLARERETGGIYDAFRDRLMFPIADPSGRLVGFGGRIIGEGEPKYLNTPETLIFAKGSLLYGLDRARASIDATGTALVVEGYTDVMRCHEHGFVNAVATLGTALGAEHVRLLRRFGAERVVMVYDADEAGIKASERALEILIESEMPGAVATLRGGLDPCEFLEQHPADEFRAAVEGAQDLFEYKIARTTAGRDLKDVNERARAAHALMEVVGRSTDAIKRALLRRRVADAVGVSERELESGHPMRAAAAAGVAVARTSEPAGLMARAERDLAWLLVKYPAGADVVRADINVAVLADPVVKEIVETVLGLSVSGAAPDERTLLDHLSPAAVAFAVNVMETEATSKPEMLAGRLSAAAVALSLLRLPDRIAELDRQRREAERSGNEGKTVELLRDLSELEQLRRRLQARGRGRGRTDAAKPGAEEGH